MKLLVLSLFIINILSFLKTVVGISSDCENLNTFLNIDTSLNCCEENYAACDSGGNIVELQFMDFEDYNNNHFNLGNLNYNNFPIFQNLINITFAGIQGFNKNTLPSIFFDQPSLNYLRVTTSNIKNIPQNINKNSSVEIIELYINEIPEFPYHLKDLKNLKQLHLASNKITGEIDLKDFNSLTKFDIRQNRITNIKNFPSTLSYLDIAATSITELPPDLFKLKNLKKLYFEDNPNLKAKIIGFENPVEECGFEGTPIDCYKAGSCTAIVKYGENDEILGIVNGNEQIFEECTDTEIKEIKNKQTTEESINQDTTNNDTKPTNNDNDKITNTKKDPNNNNNSYFKYIIIGGCGILVLILLLVFIVKRHSSKNSDKYDIYVYDNRNNSVNTDNNMNSTSNNVTMRDNSEMINNSNSNRLVSSNDNNHINSGKAMDSVNHNNDNSEKPPAYDSIVIY